MLPSKELGYRHQTSIEHVDSSKGGLWEWVLEDLMTAAFLPMHPSRLATTVDAMTEVEDREF